MSRNFSPEDLFPAMEHAKGVALTGWIVVEGYCAMRCMAGMDTESLENRVAFIEKTPRVRVAPMVGADESLDAGSNWAFGYKGNGGSGDAEELGLYGFDVNSRAWCDSKLKEMGYLLTTTAD